MYARDDMLVTLCMTPCCAAMIMVSSGQFWLVLADLAVLRLCWAKRAHSADRCCAYWWSGLMLRAAVTAVRSVSFKPMRPLSGVCASCIFSLKLGGQAFIWDASSSLNDEQVRKTKYIYIYISIYTVYIYRYLYTYTRASFTTMHCIATP